jgi:hypothetical protein
MALAHFKKCLSNLFAFARNPLSPAAFPAVQTHDGYDDWVVDGTRLVYSMTSAYRAAA